MAFTTYGKNNDVKIIAKLCSAMQLASSIRETKIYQGGRDEKAEGKVYISLEINGHLSEEELAEVEKTITVAD